MLSSFDAPSFRSRGLQWSWCTLIDLRPTQRISKSPLRRGRIQISNRQPPHHLETHALCFVLGLRTRDGCSRLCPSINDRPIGRLPSCKPSGTMCCVPVLRSGLSTNDELNRQLRRLAERFFFSSFNLLANAGPFGHLILTSRAVPRRHGDEEGERKKRASSRAAWIPGGGSSDGGKQRAKSPSPPGVPRLPVSPGWCALTWGEGGLDCDHYSAPAAVYVTLLARNIDEIGRAPPRSRLPAKPK